jgi:hypothetical protein
MISGKPDDDKRKSLQASVDKAVPKRLERQNRLIHQRKPCFGRSRQTQTKVTELDHWTKTRPLQINNSRQSSLVAYSFSLDNSSTTPPREAVLGRSADHRLRSGDLSEENRDTQLV